MATYTNTQSYDNSPRGLVLRAISYAKKDFQGITQLLNTANVEFDTDKLFEAYVGIKLQLIKNAVDNHETKASVEDRLLAKFGV